MIDTVTFWIDRPLIHSSSKNTWWEYGWNLLPNMEEVRFRHFPSRPNSLRSSFLVETSLPKLLFGNNARLLKSQSDLDAAMSKAKDAFQAFLPVVWQPRFTRVDLCWNYRCDPIKFLLAHESSNHPQIMGYTCSYRNKAQRTGITWKGSELLIRFYDKSRDAKAAGFFFNKLIRVEVELHGQRLRTFFSANPKKSLTQLNLESCYRVFRRILKNFPQPRPIPILEGWHDLALAAQQKGVPVFEILEKKLGEQTLRKLRNYIARRQIRYFKVDWDWMLPQQFPPPMTIHPKARKMPD
jgi:hypothetical protein